MRYGTGDNQFDLSDVEVAGDVDDLDSILDVAAEVLRDYGGESGNGRMVRMARYLVRNLGTTPHEYPDLELATGGLQVSIPDPAEFGFGDSLYIGDFELNTEQALCVAALILRTVQTLR